ncbi:MAG: ABC transporter ATP-binding protein [Clostridiales bacterium]|nr:ABC transporter ATP-binding protein [Clostridiales bacterium]
MLEIKNLSKSYGDKVAVNDLSLTVRPGEICGFIGHNGAGKTTTIRAITGVMAFDAGEITIMGHSVKREPIECKRLTAYVPDNPDLYDYMTGAQYVRFICDVWRVEQSKRAGALRELAQMFEIERNLNDLIGSYSHGMRQKLALIAALIHEPKLMVLDEPFVGLDPVAAHQVKQLMRERCRQGAMVFFSTHVLDVAEKLCDRIAIIRGGKLIAHGPTGEVRGNQSLEDVFLELIDDA